MNCVDMLNSNMIEFTGVTHASAVFTLKEAIAGNFGTESCVVTYDFRNFSVDDAGRSLAEPELDFKAHETHPDLVWLLPCRDNFWPIFRTFSKKVGDSTGF